MAIRIYNVLGRLFAFYDPNSLQYMWRNNYYNNYNYITTIAISIDYL
jgi:hypothetical protein